MSPTLLGRAEELHRLDELGHAARNGVSRALLVRGAPGIGKSALLDAAAERLPASVRLDGVVAESTLGFAGLHRLLTRLPGRDPASPAGAGLPEPQRRALEVALGLGDGPPPDRFLVGLGVLSTLAAAAGDAGGLCVLVDDAQWLDPESLDALGFVARRIKAEGLGLVFAERDEHASRVAGVPVLELGGLGDDDAAALLRASVDGALDPRVAASILTATGGNPLAIIDLGQELSDRELTGGVSLAEPLPLGSHLEDHYARRIAGYPTAARSWLLLAAAEPQGDAGIVAAAAELLGLPADASAHAERDRLVARRPELAFRHSLVRSAVYNSATSAERRAVHAALATATRPDEAARRALHLAAASAGPDESVAALLEAEGRRAAGRGGYAARASLLARARELTPPGPERSRRTVAAAEAAIEAGAPTAAVSLLDELAAVDPDGADLAPTDRARILLVRASADTYLGVPQSFATMAARRLRAAELLEADAPHAAVEAMLHAWQGAIGAEWMLRGVDRAALAEAGFRIAARARAATAAATASTPGSPPGATARVSGAEAPVLLLESLSSLDGPFDAETAARHHAALAALAAEDADPRFLAQHAQLAFAPGTWLFEERLRDRVLRRGESAARELGALAALDITLWVHSLLDADLGRLREARRALEEVYDLRGAIGLSPEQSEVFSNVDLLAWAGPAPGLDERIERSAEASIALGLGSAHRLATTARMLLALAAGDHEAAHPLARDLVDRAFPQVRIHSLPDLVETAARTGRVDEAAAAVHRLDELAAASGTAFAAGIAARSRALLLETEADGHPELVDAAYATAEASLATTLSRSDLARTRLLHGEWLRRRLRRRDAAEQLRAALALFETGGMAGFADRARRELRALGIDAAPQAEHRGPELTAQESAVAELALQGRTNAEIGAVLFLSPNTVAYHLRKVFRKLGVSSRRRLAEAFPPEH